MSLYAYIHFCHFREWEEQNRENLFRNLLEKMKFWCSRYRQRRQLLEMDSRMLQDIGISRADALREGEKSFWN